MLLIQFAIQNPVKVAVAVMLSVMFGLIAFFATPVQLTPDVTEPEITITTRWPGASAQEVEREIIEEQEEQLKSVQGLREFKSESSDSQGTIVLEFEVGVDLGDSRARVSDKLNQVAEYPEDAREPTITTVNPTSGAISWFILQPQLPAVAELKTFVGDHPELAEILSGMISGQQEIQPSILYRYAEQYPALKDLFSKQNDPARMRKFAQDHIEARFERIAGVANANVFGGQEEEFRVVVDPARLAAYNLTIADLRKVLRDQNKNTSGGDIWEGKHRNVIRTISLFDTPEKVAETVVAIRDNTPIRVRDLAKVELNYKKPDGVVRQKGVTGLAINVQQAPGSNVLKIIGPPLEKLDLNGDGEFTQLELSEAKRIYGDCLRIATAEMNLGVLKQKGVWLEQVYDQSEYVHSATELVTESIFIGGGLAILVLLIFLRSLRSVLIIGLSIPISVIATFLFVKGFGRSINVISLAGMAFAVGMVVDNAIVVLENIFRHYQRGAEPEQAALIGTTEVWGAVLASTLTTLAVFVPVIFVNGQAGQLFRDISIAISCAVGLSLIVSITVIPAAASRILKRRGSKPYQPSKDNEISDIGGSSGFPQWFGLHIVKLMNVRGSFLIRTAIVVLFVTTSIFGALYLMPETEYLPNGNRNLVFAILMPPPGYNLNKMIELGESIEEKLAPYWEDLPGTADRGPRQGPQIENFFFVARGRSLFMGARSKDPLRAAELVPIMSKAAGTIPGVFAFAKQSSLFESALTGGRTIEIEITGPDLKTLVDTGKQIFGMCMQNFPMDEGNQIRPVPSLDLSSPELHILPKLVKAAELGVSATELGYAVDALVDGAYAGDYWHNGTKIDLVIFGAEDYTRHSHDLENLPINTPAGKLVSLSSVADVKLASGPEQINHSERLRTITIMLTPAPDLPLETAMNIVNEKIRLPLLNSPVFENGQYQIRLAGTADKLDQTRQELQWNLVLALVITYLLMAALFESFLFPAVIMTSVILALVGGFVGLSLLNQFILQPLDMLTMLGFVILIGTVVNSAILIVHQALQNMRIHKMDERLAIVESVRTRIRPIFMSTMTTVLGMLPLVLPWPVLNNGSLSFVPGTGSELYRGLGSVVMGGLIVSTVFTLVLVPIGFSLALDIKRFMANMFRMKDSAPATDVVIPAVHSNPMNEVQVANVPVSSEPAVTSGTRSASDA